MRVRLDTITKVKDFVKIIETNDIKGTLSHGEFTVDAGSILGVLSLDLSNPLELKVKNSEDINMVAGLLKEFVVEA